MFNNRNRNSTSLIIRMIAGGYLIYLVYQMIKDGALTNNTGWKLVVMAAAMIAFVGFGIYFIVKGFQGLRKNREEEEAETVEEIEEPEDYKDEPGEMEETEEQTGNGGKLPESGKTENENKGEQK